MKTEDMFMFITQMVTYQLPVVLRYIKIIVEKSYRIRLMILKDITDVMLYGGFQLEKKKEQLLGTNFIKKHLSLD